MSNYLRLLFWGKLSPCIIVFLLTSHPHLLAQETSSYPAVQLDLNAGSFLTPLPFDRPFLIQGFAPQDITHIRVTFEEFFDAGHPFAEHPKRVASFQMGVETILDSLFLDTSLTTNERLRTIEHHLDDLLLQQSQATDGLSINSAMVVFPWNWGNWMMTRSGSKKVLTNGSMFDSSDDGIASKQRFRALIETIEPGIQHSRNIDRAVGFVVDELQTVRIVSAPAPSPQKVQGTWQKLHNTQVTHSPPLQIDAPSRWNRLEQRLQGNAITNTGEFRLVIPPLESNRTYLVRVQADRNSPADTVKIRPLTTQFWADTQSNDYVSLDVGLLYAREIKETSVYIGTNFYLRPVAKSVPLQTRGGFLRRFAFTIGIAVQNIEDERSTRHALIGPVSLVMGAGIRVSKYVRLGGGALLFRARDPETFPLTTKTSLTGSPYVSASFDMDVGKHLKGLGGLFGIFDKGDVE